MGGYLRAVRHLGPTFAGFLRLTLVFVWSVALLERFNCFF